MGGVLLFLQRRTMKKGWCIHRTTPVQILSWRMLERRNRRHAKLASSVLMVCQVGNILCGIRESKLVVLVIPGYVLGYPKSIYPGTPQKIYPFSEQNTDSAPPAVEPSAIDTSREKRSPCTAGGTTSKTRPEQVPERAAAERTAPEGAHGACVPMPPPSRGGPPL